MKKLFLLLLFSSSAFAQTESVEMILKHNGNMVEAHDKDQIRNTWAQRIIRGTSGRPYFLFVDSLYSKYFYRVIKTTTVFRDTVSPGGMNFRQHQSNPDILRAFDIKKVSIEENLTQAWLDILDTSIADSVRNDEVEDVLEWERWEYGTMGRKEFIIMRFDSLTQAQADSYMTEIDTIVVIDGVPDTTRRIPRLGVTVSFLRDSVIVLGESLKNLTLRDLAQSGQVPQKIKTWFQNHVIGRAGITLDTTVWVLLRDHRGKIPYLFMKHPVIARKIKRKWLKKL